MPSQTFRFTYQIACLQSCITFKWGWGGRRENERGREWRWREERERVRVYLKQSSNENVITATRQLPAWILRRKPSIPARENKWTSAAGSVVAHQHGHSFMVLTFHVTYYGRTKIASSCRSTLMHNASSLNRTCYRISGSELTMRILWRGESGPTEYHQHCKLSRPMAHVKNAKAGDRSWSETRTMSEVILMPHTRWATCRRA